MGAHLGRPQGASRAQAPGAMRPSFSLWFNAFAAFSVAISNNSWADIRGNMCASVCISASILNAGGLPELVTQALGDYASLACRLATEKTFLHEMRDRVRAARAGTPLFDAGAFARDLENLYRDLAGETPGYPWNRR